MPTTILSLPVELRLAIYSDLLVMPGHITIETTTSPDGAGHYHSPPRVVTDGAKKHTGILYVNRTIHAEAASVLYSRNVFSFAKAGGVQRGKDNPVDTFRCFLETVGEANARSVRKLSIHFPGHGICLQRGRLIPDPIISGVTKLVVAECPSVEPDQEVVVEGDLGASDMAAMIVEMLAVAPSSLITVCVALPQLELHWHAGEKWESVRGRAQQMQEMKGYGRLYRQLEEMLTPWGWRSAVSRSHGRGGAVDKAKPSLWKVSLRADENDVANVGVAAAGPGRCRWCAMETMAAYEKMDHGKWMGMLGKAGLGRV